MERRAAERILVEAERNQGGGEDRGRGKEMGKNTGPMASARGLLLEERTSGTRALGATMHWGRRTHSRILMAALMHVRSFIHLLIHSPNSH